MTISSAVARIEEWTVTGVTTNLAIDARQVVTKQMLPLMTLEFSGQGGEGFTIIDFDLTTKQVVLFVEHLVLFESMGMADRGVPQRLVFTVMDNYMARLRSDPRLFGALTEPIQVAGVWYGNRAFRGVQYMAMTLRHRWVLEY